MAGDQDERGLCGSMLSLSGRNAGVGQRGKDFILNDNFCFLIRIDSFEVLNIVIAITLPNHAQAAGQKRS